MNIPILSIQIYDITKYEPIGMVNAISVHSISLLRNIFSNLTSLFGGQQELIESRYMELREEVLKKLRLKAYNMNADIVLGVEYDISTFDDKYMIFSINGTALKLKNKNNKNNKNKYIKKANNIFL